MFLKLMRVFFSTVRSKDYLSLSVPIYCDYSFNKVLITLIINNGIPTSNRSNYKLINR